MPACAGVTVLLECPYCHARTSVAQPSVSGASVVPGGKVRCVQCGRMHAAVPADESAAEAAATRRRRWRSAVTALLVGAVAVFAAIDCRGGA